MRALLRLRESYCRRDWMYLIHKEEKWQRNIKESKGVSA